MSTIASVSTVCLILHFTGVWNLGRDDPVAEYLGAAIFVSIIMVPIDYLSLLETRWVLARAQRSSIPLAVWLLIDLVLTTAICIVGLFVITGCMAAIMYLIMDYDANDLSSNDFDKIVRQDQTRSSPVLLPAFFATFFTSAVFYAYVLTVLTFKTLHLNQKRIMDVIERLATSANLFKAIGGVIGAFVVLLKAGTDLFNTATG